MNTGPLVSILIPAYNAGTWIADSIESALNQTWASKEIIVVNDGSADNTLEVAKRFEKDGVIVHDQPNSGAAAARNKAFELSSGDYIQWLDADDILDLDKISEQLALLTPDTSDRTLFSARWGKFFFCTSRARFRPSPLWDDVTPAEWLYRKMKYNCHQQTATWLVSRRVTEDAGPWDTRLLGDDDGEYFCRIKLAADYIKFVPSSIVFYRHVNNSRLSYIGSSSEKMDAQLLSMNVHINSLLQLEDTERTRAACVIYIQKYVFDFHPERPDLVEKLRLMAQELGGEITLPKIPWKYSLIDGIFGTRASKWAQFTAPGIKARFLSAWDRVLYSFEQNR